MRVAHSLQQRNSALNVSVESTEGLERRLKVAVPAERVENEIDRRLKEMSRRARIKGFRPGKAPLKVIRQQYGAQVRDDVVTELVQASWFEAISAQKLRPVGNPKIEGHKAEKGEDLTFTAVFEVFPEIELKGLDGIEVECPVAEIQPTDVDAVIEKLRAQRGHWHVVERPAREADRVTMDFAGTVDGQPFRGGDGNDVAVVLGAGRMLRDFEAGLEGIAAGEERSIEVAFPADYAAEEVAGKQAHFKVTARKVEEPHLPDVDEEFCRAFGIEEGGVERLRTEVEDNMREEMNQRVREIVKRQLLDSLVAANSVDIPAALLEQEIQSLRQDMARRMNPGAASGTAELPPREPFEAAARFRVKLGLLIGEIVRGHQLRVDAGRVQRRLEMIGDEYGNREEVIRIYRGKPELMSQVETAVLEEQVVDWLLERAQLTEKAIEFSELMNQDQA
jgi:trigger factor